MNGKVTMIEGSAKCEFNFIAQSIEDLLNSKHSDEYKLLVIRTHVENLRDSARNIETKAKLRTHEPVLMEDV